MIHFNLPKEKSSIIKVIGIGCGGSSAIEKMLMQQIEGVNFIICDTDVTALEKNKIPNKIQIGPYLTQGQGSGANPAVGKQATEESLEEIRRVLEVNTEMVVITAAMGRGTGTGGAPVIAKLCKELGILTVAIVTFPFSYEGPKLIRQAEVGISELRQYIDSFVIINNDTLSQQLGNLRMEEVFIKVDDIIISTVKCIMDMFNCNGQINVDFSDICTVIRGGGEAIIGSALASGRTRATKAIKEVLNPLIHNGNCIVGAKWILLSIHSGEDDEFIMDEVEIIQDYLLQQAGENTDVIMGLGYDERLGDTLKISIIVTGISNKPLLRNTASAADMQDESDNVFELREKVEAPFELTSNKLISNDAFIYLSGKPVPYVLINQIKNEYTIFKTTLVKPRYGKALLGLPAKLLMPLQLFFSNSRQQEKESKRNLDLVNTQNNLLNKISRHIIDLLEKESEGIVKIGSVIVLKIRVNNTPRIVVKKIGPKLKTCLEEKPTIMMNLPLMAETLVYKKITTKQIQDLYKNYIQ